MNAPERLPAADPFAELLAKPWQLPAQEPMTAEQYEREAIADAQDELDEPAQDLG